MRLDDFIKEYTAKVTGDTPENTGQCVGLVEKWADVNGWEHIWGNAKDLIKNADTNFYDCFNNTPDNVPQAGDILVWGEKVGQYGHTAIFVDGNVNTFHSFDQNWPLGSPPHLQLHDYFGVVGWIRPKNASIRPENSPKTADSPKVDDKYVYDFGGTIGKQELGAVRSMILDLRRMVATQPLPITLANFSTGEIIREIFHRFGLG